MIKSHSIIPFVSVIVNCKNSQKYIRQCIMSVQNQTYQNFEIIVYDNLSTDKTKLLISQVAKNDKKIKFFTSSSELTLGSARNNAIACSKGDFIAFLDSDDLWHRKKLEQQILNINKNIDYFFATTSNFYSSINNLSMNKTSKKIASLKFPDPKNGNHFKGLLAQNYISISGLMFRKNLLNKIGLFDSTLTHAEDYDFILRAALVSKGIRAGLIFYRIHENNLSKSQFHISHYETIMILDKYHKFIYARVIKSMLIFRYFLISLKKNESHYFFKNIKVNFNFFINLFIGFHTHTYFMFKNKRNETTYAPQL